MIDYSHANGEAVKALGLVDGWDKDRHDGWANEALIRILDDLEDGQWTQGHGEDAIRVWLYYQEHIAPPEKWAELVKSAPPQTNEYDPRVNYTDKPPTNFEPPTSVQETSGGKGEVVVSVEAIEYFCRQLEAISDDKTLDHAIGLFAGLNIKPGTFGHAVALRDTITGVGGSEVDSGLKGHTVAFLSAVKEALVDLRQNLRAMLNEYENTEELNKITVNTFNDVMSDTWSRINSFKDSGTDSSGVPGGSGGDDEDGGGENENGKS